MLWKRFALMVCLSGLATAYAADPVIPGAQAPLPAPHLPESGTGFLDMFIKLLPSLITPIVSVLVTMYLPKVPPAARVAIAATVTAAGGALTAPIGDVILPGDGGGVQPDFAAAQGGMTAVTVQSGVEVLKAKTAEEQHPTRKG